MHCYANAPVCAPSRSTWITGIHAISMGTHQMRSRYPIPHDRIKYYPDHLKKAGYYVGNVTKTDYNIGGRPDDEAWDTDKVDWKSLQAEAALLHGHQQHQVPRVESLRRCRPTPSTARTR